MTRLTIVDTDILIDAARQVETAISCIDRIESQSALRESEMVVKSLQELKDLLVSEDMDITCWGINSAKNIENLWDEILEGETVIQQSPLLRVISVVIILIRKGSNILIETKQELFDGRTRLRNYPPSEKIKAGENYLDAAIRCLEEELQIGRDNIKILESTHRESYKQDKSPSYPGLTTQYIFHTVEAEIDSLPTTDFSTSEATQNFKDPVKTHYWVWVFEDHIQN